ncbi:MAG: hypothetical protein LBC92_00665 [Rickettsiales bacterium]|jgi:hypothetical protein|nr:hypothetical protein [Rickettsiales bacterium]
METYNYDNFLNLCIERKCKFTEQELKKEIEKLKFYPLIAYHKNQKVIFEGKVQSDEVNLHIPSSIMKILIEFENYFNNLCGKQIKFDWRVDSGSVVFDINKYIAEYGHQHIYIIISILIVCGGIGGYYYLKHLKKIETIKQEAETSRNNDNNETKLIEKCLTMIDNNYCKKIIEYSNFYQKRVISNYKVAQKELRELHYCGKNFSKEELDEIEEYNLKIEQENNKSEITETWEIVNLKVFKAIVNESKSKKWNVGILKGDEVVGIKFSVNMNDASFQKRINESNIKPDIIRALLITKEIINIDKEIKYEYDVNEVYVLNETEKIRDIPQNVPRTPTIKNNDQQLNFFSELENINLKR